MSAQVFYGHRCPRCGTTIDVDASVTIGGSPKNNPVCPTCGADMVPNPNARGTTLNAYCRKCNSMSGMVNSDVCPDCGEPFAA